MSLTLTQVTVIQSSVSRPPGVPSIPEVPRCLPNTALLRGAGTRVSNGTKIGSSRALAALRRSVRLITMSRHMSNLPTTSGRKWNINAADDDGLGDSETRRHDESSASSEDEDIVEDKNVLATGNEKPAGAANSAMIASGALTRGGKSGPKRGTEDRRWAMTVQFYEHVATAAARLEFNRTDDTG